MANEFRPGQIVPRVQASTVLHMIRRTLICHTRSRL